MKLPTKNTTYRVLGFIIGLFVVGAISGARNQPAHGVVMTKETFNNGCVPAAEKNNTLTPDQATTYCGCVYDKGVEFYGGGEQWTKELENAGNTVTPKMNEFVNACIQELQNAQQTNSI